MVEAEENSTGLDGTSPEEVAAAEAEPQAEAPTVSSGPGKMRRALGWLYRWHPLVFLGAAGCLAVVAWAVYPESETRQIIPAETFYYDGLDRLYRVVNPDLPLIAESPTDEALAARNAFLNLFVFHREDLRNYPQFINPHLLLAETNRILAEFNPAMAAKYHADAAGAYSDAMLWETRDDTPEHLAAYISRNYLDGREIGSEETLDDEIALRRDRRLEYIRYRQAEADVNLGHPELARPVLETIQRAIDGRRREDLRRSAVEIAGASEPPRRVFELGPDEYGKLDLLMARTYDGLGLFAQARSWYLRYLGNAPGGRTHAFVVERLADISLQEGEVYRKVNSETARRHYGDAAGYYAELMASQSATREQRETAILGLAVSNSRLAELVPGDEMTGIDELSGAGRQLRRWLEDFSGQPLPRRTLALPVAVGGLLAAPEMLVPGPATLPGVVGGTLASMAGGGMVTPHEERRWHLVLALENYDRLAELGQGTVAGDRARVRAAWESWNLGRKRETEARLERMLDALSSDELVLAARLGLATIALDRGDLRRAQTMILGGYAHPLPLWFLPADADWRKIAARLGNPASRGQPGVWRRIWETLPDEGREIARYAASGRRLDDEYIGRLLSSLNTMLRRQDFYRTDDFPGQDRNVHLTYLLDRNPELLTSEDVVWRNRLLIEEVLPYDLSQRAAKDVVGFPPFPPRDEIPPGGLLESERIRVFLVDLARAWRREFERTADRAEKLRAGLESVNVYETALNEYRADAGEVLYELAGNFEQLADIREGQGNHPEALSLTARAARTYLGVSLRAQGSPREMESLLAAGDAFFRAGLLERTIESQLRFLERFGYSSRPGSDGALAVVRAENLLGRAYWFLNDTDKALESFRRNIPRRTPDRYKSMYYIGRVLLDEGIFRNDPVLLGDNADPLPDLDRNSDPVIETALQAFNHIRQDPGINPVARAWRWSTFDLARLHHAFAERARAAAGTAPANGQQVAPAGSDTGREENAWLGLYDTARVHLTEALERYPLRRNGGIGLSVRVEPEDYADVMASRFEAENMLANTLLALAEGRQDDSLSSLARAHLENLRDRRRYANALFDPSLDRFQLNAAIIREEVEGGNWDNDIPLPRTRLGDDEGPTHNPAQLRRMLRNSMILLANEYFKAGEKASQRTLLAAAAPVPAPVSDAATSYYRDAYRTYQDIYDRFGVYFGPQAMVGMGDSLSRLGYPDDAANHYRMARNMVDLLPADAVPEEGLVDLGPTFWGGIAAERLRDMEGGYTVP